jgi:hypothetical protein
MKLTDCWSFRQQAAEHSGSQITCRNDSLSRRHTLTEPFDTLLPIQ